MTPARVPMLDVLRAPASAADLTTDDWIALLGAARHSDLLPRLSWLIEDAGVMDALPIRVRDQLRAARPTGDHHRRSICWEVQRIGEALRELDTKIVLLKGAAYTVAGLPAGYGRLASDVDILVPRQDLRRVETALLQAGWAAVTLHAYDERFYREWSHELPPLQHVRRRTTVDVHHNILPLTGRLHPDATKLLAAAVPIDNGDVHGLWRLGAEDMVLHCAVHLFQDGELGGSIRDLVDADALVSDFAHCDSQFWTRLVARAGELGLGRPLFYVLRYARRLLQTSVPDDVEAALPKPSSPVLRLMDRLVMRAMLPVTGQHGTRRNRPTAVVHSFSLAPDASRQARGALDSQGAAAFLGR
jgi:hypothetical protein